MGNVSENMPLSLKTTYCGHSGEHCSVQTSIYRLKTMLLVWIVVQHEQRTEQIGVSKYAEISMYLVDAFSSVRSVLV